MNPFKNCSVTESMFSKSFTKHFRGFVSGLTEIHAKIDADMLLNFAIHHRQNKI
jgi:hypothetical protein